MSLKKKLLIILLPFIFIFILTSANAEENLKSLGKFKDWQSFVLLKEGVKTCFAQSIPVVKAPKKFKRDPSRLFVSFRPAENIKNEVSVTNGYELTFHRAFDYLLEQEKSLEQLIENKFDRILCSGSKINSEKGFKNLNYLNSLAKDKITIMPGGGINLKNFNLFKNAGFNEIHLSAIDKKISLDSDYNIIKQIIEMSK